MTALRFPESEKFPRHSAPLPETGGIPPESAFFYEELRATAESCRELILKREIRGKFTIFSVSLPPPFVGSSLCDIGVSRVGVLLRVPQLERLVPARRSAASMRRAIERAQRRPGSPPQPSQA